MYRTLFGWAALGLLVLATGCTFCASPYDYCGPTFTGDGCSGGHCNPRLRSGSVLAPADMAMVSGGTVTHGQLLPGQVISDDAVIEEGSPVLQGVPAPTRAKPEGRSARRPERTQVQR